MFSCLKYEFFLVWMKLRSENLFPFVLFFIFINLKSEWVSECNKNKETWIFFSFIIIYMRLFIELYEIRKEPLRKWMRIWVNSHFFHSLCCCFDKNNNIVCRNWDSIKFLIDRTNNRKKNLRLKQLIKTKRERSKERVIEIICFKWVYIYTSNMIVTHL